MNGREQDRTAYLDYVARCNQAFTPFAPIELPDFFAGREHVIADIRAELEAPGRQVAIYGERGVGKTSLAVLLYFFAGYEDDRVHVFRCHEGATFDDICVALLIDAGRRLSVHETRTETGWRGEARIPLVSGSKSRRTSTTLRPIRDVQTITLRRMLETFQQTRGLLIIDEFDRIADAETKTRMAEMIKHFSDARSQSKIVIVGVAETLNDLIGRHESLSRSLAQIGLDRMDDPELMDIIDRGAQRTGTKFGAPVATKIVRLADGFPHFVHLICRYASAFAGRCLLADGLKEPLVGDPEYRQGLKGAISKAEHSLQDDYDSAIVTTRRKSDIYELTLRAMALSDQRDVQVRDLASHASYLTGDELRPEKFSNALGVLIKTERNRVLTKVRDGYYKFTNPLMRPFVRFLLEFDNLTHHRGQLEFPFMRRD